MGLLGFLFQFVKTPIAQMPFEPLEPERPPLARLFWLFGLWFAIWAASTLQIAAANMGTWRSAALLALSDWGPWIFWSPIVLWLAVHVPVDGSTWRWSVPIHLLGCVATIILMDWVMKFVVAHDWVHFGPPRGQHFGPGAEGFHFEQSPNDRFHDAPNHREMREPFFGFMRARFTAPIYFVLVAGAHAFGYHRRSIERERRALAAEAGLTEAKLAALQAQLNPHFLFNTLNAIAHYVYTNPAAAEEMITSLSDLLRSVLASSDRREVSLQQ